MDHAAADALPQSLSAWPTFLWSRVLFPGASPHDSERVHVASLLILLFVPALLLYPCLSFPLFEPDESRYAEIPREMLQHGDWITPRLQGEPYLEKPPLLYWITAVSFQLFGVHDWAARLPPALAVHGTILVLYFLGRRGFGEAAAFRGALMLSLAPGFVSIGRLLIIDGVLTFCTTLALSAPSRPCAVAVALELVAAVGGRMWPRRPQQRPRRAGAAGAAVAPAPLAYRSAAAGVARGGRRFSRSRRRAVLALVRSALPPRPCLRIHLLLGTQRHALLDAVRPRARHMVLRPGAAAGAAARHFTDLALSTLFRLF